MKKINIETDLFGSKLRMYLHGKGFENDINSVLLKIISDLSNSELNMIEKLEFNTSETETINSIDITSICSNMEIIARWCDYSQNTKKSERINFIKLAYTNYLNIFKSTIKYEYLIRSLQLVRKVRASFEGQIDFIFDYIQEVIINCSSSYYQNEILIQLTALDKDKCRDLFKVEIETKLQLYYETNKFDDARLCIDSLNVIGIVNSNECHKLKAENFEKEGDFLVKTRNPNTFDTYTAQIYLNGLQELKSLQNNCLELKKRLQDKLIKEQKTHPTIIRTFGTNRIMEFDNSEIEREIYRIGIKDFDSAFINLLDLKIPTKEQITQYSENDKKMNSCDGFSPESKVNENGATVGSKDGDDVFINHAIKRLRNWNLLWIRDLKNIMDMDKQMDSNSIILLVNKSSFIPDDRKQIYMFGLLEGFNNNYISAAHMLMPQIENSLRYISEKRGIITTKLTADKQQEYLLGGCLDNLNKTQHINNDLYVELKSFFVDSSNANFRNELSHGLMAIQFIDYYGLYLWWLTLKMIVQTEEYFPSTT